MQSSSVSDSIVVAIITNIFDCRQATLGRQMQTSPCDKLDVQCFLGQFYLRPGRKELPLSWCFQTVWAVGCLRSARITKHKSEHWSDETTWKTHSQVLKWILNKWDVWASVHKCTKNLGTTSKFQMSDRWHVASATLRTYKHYTPQNKI